MFPVIYFGFGFKDPCQPLLVANQTLGLRYIEETNLPVADELSLKTFQGKPVK